MNFNIGLRVEENVHRIICMDNMHYAGMSRIGVYDTDICLHISFAYEKSLSLWKYK